MIIILVLSFLFFKTKPVKAVWNYELCYANGAAYHFWWNQDICWNMFQQVCSTGEAGTSFKVGGYLWNLYWVASKGDPLTVDITPLFALLACKPLINDCIAPTLQSIKTECQANNYYYSPNLFATETWSNASYTPLFYSEERKTLTARVINNGTAYAKDIGVDISYSTTKDRKTPTSGGGMLVHETIPELTYFGAVQSGTRSLYDKIGDFFINQSNLSGLLSDYKSDKDHHYVPSIWQKDIPFQAYDNELTKIIINVDPLQFISESNESDNTFTLIIDKLPTPSKYEIKNFKLIRQADSLTSYQAQYDIYNSGEEGGDVTVKWFEGTPDNAVGSLTESPRFVDGKKTISRTHDFQVDVSKGSNYCGNSKKYSIQLIGEDGPHDQKTFTIPLFAGEVYGDIEDLFGKAIEGATVTTDTGQSATTDKNGHYHIKGINKLGKISLTATHPEFSKVETKDVELKFNSDPFLDCNIDGLTVLNADFVLKDVDVLFTVTVKDTSGNPVNAHVLAVNTEFRTEANINGSGPLKELQPGKYLFTISAPGYKTISQTVDAVPSDETLEFTLEKLAGRPDDNGLHLVTPRLLWKKTLGSGERIISQMNGSKNGNLLLAYVLDNKSKNSNLFFLDLLTGRQIKEASVPYTISDRRFVGLDTSYDGGTVGLSIDLGIPKDNERIMKVFDSVGNELGTTTLSKGTGGLVTSMDVSPDGFYLCPDKLMDKGLHKYTRYETEGKMDYKKGSEEAANCGFHFLRNDDYLDSCNGGLCEKTIANQQVRIISNIDEGLSLTSTIFDSAFNNQTVVVRSFKKLYYFGQSTWKKELKSDNNYKSVAVSPGGMYTIVTEGDGSGASLKLKVFGNTGGDKTLDFPYKDVKFVFANDKGLFFATVVLNRISFYQVGEYNNEYKPDVISPTTSPEWTDGISFYSHNQFWPAGLKAFFNLDPGLIYRADKSIRMDIKNPYNNTSLGTLSITKDSLFSIDNNQHPVLLKGQMTAEFTSPATVYAIKFDRYDLSLFQTKLNQFIAGTLSEDEYFIVKNIHTRFTLTDNPNKINLAVDSGIVQVSSKKLDRSVGEGKQIAIDAKNNIQESVYFGPNIYLIIGAVLILIVSILLFFYRNTPVGKKILSILKIIVLCLRKSIIQIFKWLWLFIQKVIPIIWRILKNTGLGLWKMSTNLLRKKQNKS